ncbi:MAG: cell division protein FtsW [Clostridia bacterium]|nr:cell division protein FtsW [Clostridia bacterium]
MVLLGLCLAASLYGVVLIYSATRYMNSNRYVTVQLLAIGLGVLLYMAMSFVDIELLTERSWRLLLAFNVLAIVSLIPFGSNIGGNKSWIDLKIISVQPAEIVKISFIILLAKQFSVLQKEGLNHISSLCQVGAHTIFMCGLIAAISKDMGMVLVYLFIFLIMAWSAGVRLRWFAMGAVAAGVGGYFIWPHLGSHIHDRIAILFDHSLDPLGVGYQQSRSILAIGSGGLTGQGYLQGTQVQSSGGLLPAQWTDFIYAVAGEEFGMIGCIAILLLLSAIILRCIWVAHIARSSQSALIAAGCAGMLGVQVFLNVGMCLYILPVVGLTLPFFSSGGSSIITLFAAMGIVSSIKMRTLPSWLQDRSNL